MYKEYYIKYKFLLIILASFFTSSTLFISKDISKLHASVTHSKLDQINSQKATNNNLKSQTNLIKKLNNPLLKNQEEDSYVTQVRWLWTIFAKYDFGYTFWNPDFRFQDLYDLIFFRNDYQKIDTLKNTLEHWEQNRDNYTESYLIALFGYEPNLPTKIPNTWEGIKAYLKLPSFSEIFQNNQFYKLHADYTSTWSQIKLHYFGYKITFDNNDNIFSWFFNVDGSLPSTANPTNFLAKINQSFFSDNTFCLPGTQYVGNTGVMQFFQTLKDGYLLNEINTLVNKEKPYVRIDATSLFNLVKDNFFGYALSSNDVLSPILFGPDPNSPKLMSIDEITNNLIAFQANKGLDLAKFIGNYLNTPGTPIPSTNLNDLKSSWLKTSLVEQTNKLNQDANTLFNLVNQNYFGYQIANTSDSLYVILFGSSSTNPIIQSSNQILVSLKGLKMDAVTLLKKYINPGAQNSLDPHNLINSWLKDILLLQATNLSWDGSNIYFLVSSNCFGYQLSQLDPLANIIFDNINDKNIANSHINNIATICHNIETTYKTKTKLFLTNYFENPGNGFADSHLKINSWLATEFGNSTSNDTQGRQWKLLINDSQNIATIINNNFFGYPLSIPLANNLINSVLFNNDQSNYLTTKTGLEIRDSFVNQTSSNDFYSRIGVFNLINHNCLKNPDGSIIINPSINNVMSGPLYNLLVDQNNKIEFDANTLFNLVNLNYFGYSIIETSSPLYEILFGNNQNNPVIQSAKQILTNIKTLKAKSFPFLNTYINSGTKNNFNPQFLKDSWLKTILINQNNALETDLITQISVFYVNFKLAFIWHKNFNANSFIGAKNILLFFIRDCNHNLVLGKCTKQIALTFMMNLKNELLKNPNFSLINDQSVHQPNAIVNWLNSLYVKNSKGRIILQNDLKNFRAYERPFNNLFFLSNSIEFKLSDN